MLPLLRQRLDTPSVCLGLSAAAYLVFVLLRLRAHGYDPSYFVTAGDQFVDAARALGSLSILKNSSGYDGQFYYRLALDPFTGRQSDFGITLDLPETRQSRIVYPLLVWLLSLGRVDWVPGVMIGINFAAVCVLGWLGGVFAQQAKQHALWGLMFPAWAGLLLTLSRDLVEILQIALLLAGLLLIRQGRDRLAVTVLTVGTFTKETTLLSVVAIVAALWLQRQKDRWRIYVLPLCAYALWQVVLALHWGQFPLQFGTGNVGLPLVGLVTFVQTIIPPGNRFQLIWLLDVMFSVAMACAVLYALRGTAARLHEKLSWLCYGAFAMSWSRLVWVEDWAFMRHLSEFFVFGVIVLMCAPSRLKWLVAIGAGLLWLWVAQHIITLA